MKQGNLVYSTHVVTEQRKPAATKQERERESAIARKTYSVSASEPQRPVKSIRIKIDKEKLKKFATHS
jgi:hypothetical protein